MSIELSKQEYLKRYLEADNKTKKRKRKTTKSVLPKVKIIHEDVDIRSIQFGTKGEEEEVEDCPVVAEVFDDRPLEVKSKEIYESSRWKRLGSEVSERGRKANRRHDSDNDSDVPVQKKKQVESGRSELRRDLRGGKRHDSDSDLSPLRPNQPAIHSDSDLSPLRPNQHVIHSDSDLSPEREQKPSNKGDDSYLSPQRGSRGDRPGRCLSGLSAGLQNAETLKKETRDLKRRERAHIQQLEEGVAGRNAATVVRDKRTGQRRNLEEEERADGQKEEKLAEQMQKYAEWGRGMVQGSGREERLADDLYETSKPLARYIDDRDLDERLKAEILDDDPMAAYIRKKRGKTSAYPVYQGPPAPPNRFGIPPGYRWDGVDRSNGFEKRYLDQISNRKAVEREAYLWSVQDM